jgi:hypothetical protein
VLDDVVAVLGEDGGGGFDRVPGFLGEHWVGLRAKLV